MFAVAVSEACQTSTSVQVVFKRLNEIVVHIVVHDCLIILINTHKIQRNIVITNITISNSRQYQEQSQNIVVFPCPFNL